MIFGVVANLFLALNPGLAEAAWSETYCVNPDDGRSLAIRRLQDDSFHVESNLTKHFLAGLKCNVPNPDLPLFSCRQGSFSNLSFQSNLVTERGFPQDGYGNYIERESLVVYLSYYFENSKGETEQVENEWRFPISSCRWR